MPEINRDVDRIIPSEKLEAFQQLIAEGKQNNLGDNVIFLMKKA